ncbi:MAG: hypothetical protein N2444_08040, partial [Methylocystis sp.]|nr:hypothetical protein [Methylocystis sp.]
MTAPAAVPLALVLFACAPHHGDIGPANLDPTPFLQASCAELSLMRAKADRSLIFASLAQDQQARDDDTRTFGVPTPMATIFETSRAPEVAGYK